MNIQSFTRIRSYSSGTKVGMILKLRLPRLSEEAENNTVFKDFYSSVCSRYIDLAKSFSQEDQTSTKSVLRVDFSVITDEYIKMFPRFKKSNNAIVIKRTESLNQNGKIRRVEYIDVYDFFKKTFIK